MSDVMDRLRAETADLHRAAESADFQRRMASGDLSRCEYVRWLEQMLCVHRALETPLRQLRERDSRFVAVTAEQYQVPYLEADLAALGGAARAPQPLAATRRLCERLAHDAEEAPLRLLGHHYVLEGSNNGSRFIARRLRPSLGLEPGAGDRYLDPYGDEQPESWRRFKAAMASVPFTAAEVDLLVAAARDMFAAIGELSLALAEGAAATARA